MSPETMIKPRTLQGNNAPQEVEFAIPDTAFRLDGCSQSGGAASLHAIAPCALRIALYLETRGRNPHESPCTPSWLTSSVVGRGAKANLQIAVASTCGYRAPVAQRARSP